MSKDNYGLGGIYDDFFGGDSDNKDRKPSNISDKSIAIGDKPTTSDIIKKDEQTIDAINKSMIAINRALNSIEQTRASGKYDYYNDKDIFDINDFSSPIKNTPNSSTTPSHTVSHPSYTNGRSSSNTVSNTEQATPLSVDPEPTVEEVKKEIETLIGLTNIKNDIAALMDFIKVQKIRKSKGLPSNGMSLHTAFIGNPGTGKTTIARLMGKYFKALGILEKGHLVEVSRSDLVAPHVGGTAAKTNKVIDSALGGILFIDEAYALSTGSSNDYGKEAINVLVERMDKDRDRLAIFFAGYDEEMNDFFDTNSGLSSRITRKFYFEDYDGSELMEIFDLVADKNQYILDDEARKNLQAYFEHIYYVRDNNFGNGREVRNVFEKLIKHQADRIADEDWLKTTDLSNAANDSAPASLDHIDMNQLMAVTGQDVEEALHVSELLVDHDNLDHILKELNQYVGLEEIKEHISDIINLVRNNQMREDMGLPTKSMTFHSIFTGSPGTGKTTIARILGKIYQSLGILKKGHLVEVDRSSLVGSYVGHTEQKTSQVIDSAIDGILFIDEAYALAGEGNDYGQKAIDTILKRMDDDRERLIVVVAGYTNEMTEFINTNPGLKDRFTRTFDFKDFTFNELEEIFEILASKQQYVLQPDAKERLIEYFENVLTTNPVNFGNGRYVRNIFERVLMEQANRVSKIADVTRDDLVTITVADINEAVD